MQKQLEVQDSLEQGAMIQPRVTLEQGDHAHNQVNVSMENTPFILLFKVYLFGLYLVQARTWTYFVMAIFGLNPGPESSSVRTGYGYTDGAEHRHIWYTRRRKPAGIINNLSHMIREPVSYKCIEFK